MCINACSALSHVFHHMHITADCERPVDYIRTNYTHTHSVRVSLARLQSYQLYSQNSPHHTKNKSFRIWCLFWDIDILPQRSLARSFAQLADWFVCLYTYIYVLRVLVCCADGIGSEMRKTKTAARHCLKMDFQFLFIIIIIYIIYATM